MAAWNSNGLQYRAPETKTFLYKNNIDILFVSETHFTLKRYRKNTVLRHLQHQTPLR